MRIVLLACLICLGVGEEVAPGLHRAQPYGKWAYDLYVPKTYATQPEARFPALFISGSGGNPGQRDLTGWADRRGVLLVSINNSSNDTDWSELDPMQNELQTEVERRVRIHHCLRYATGDSGAGWASVRLAKHNPDRFAGVLIGIHSGNGDFAPKHCAIAFFAGEKDTTHPLTAVQGAIDTYRSQGNPVKVVLHPGGHVGPNPAETRPLLDWMLFATCISHPGLTKAELAEGVARIEGAISELGAESDPAKRVAGCAGLLEIPAIASAKTGPTLRTLWLESSLAAADAVSDPVAQHENLLATSEHPVFAGIPAKTRKEVTDRLAALRKTAPVKDEWQALQALRATREQEKKAGSAKGALGDVAKAYAGIAKRFPATAAGKQAETALAALQERMVKK